MSSVLTDAVSSITSRLDFARLLDQHGRMLQLQCALPALALIPERLVLREAVSQPFELLLDCLSTSRHFELKVLIGEQITVSLLQPDGSYAPWHGYVFEAAQLGADGGLARYRLVMRPWLSFLALRTDCYAFQDKTALQIIEEVFADYGSAQFKLQVSEALRVRSLCIQYNETDLAFVSRLLAEEGLSYRFEQFTGDAAAAADQSGHARHSLVISDRLNEPASRPALGSLRFTSQHATAKLGAQKDSVTAFMARRTLAPNAVSLGSWNYKALAGAAAELQSALSIGELPRLEVYDGAGAYRYADAAHASRAAELALSALELEFKHFEGQGTVRHMAPGSAFDLIDHPLYGANTSELNYVGALLASHQRPDNAFVLLAVEHHASNNLGAQMATLLQSTTLERGTYKNHFHAAPAAAVVIPRFSAKPTAPGLQTALVTGVQGEPLSTERDLRVKLQFPWQRGLAPLAGGLPHSGSVDTAGNAPGNEQSLTWVRLAWPSAGANWGSAFMPRAGTEVAVEFIEGDIDRPVIVGQLYNGQDAPPFAAGVDSGVNHPGVLSGLHSQALDGAGFNQWVLDDATGQLRMRLLSSYSAAQLGLGHLIQQGATAAGGAQRGAWRGSGFELATDGWASVRSGKGLLISATARAGTYGSAQSTQMDAAEATAQLKGAQDLGSRLSDAARASGAQGLTSHGAGAALDRFIQATDPKQNGKHASGVNGQEAIKPGADGRTPGADPVEAFATPVVLLDTPSTAAFATEGSFMSMAGQDTSLVSQGDVHQAAAHTWASVSGQTTSLFTHDGGIKAFAANGAVSIRAHTDELQIWADKDVTIISVNDEIRIQAKSKIELIGGQSSLVLEGGNVTFTCPGNFEVKSATHAFLGGGSRAASLVGLPDSRVKFYEEQFVAKNSLSGKPVAAMPYRIVMADGTEVTGRTDEHGRTLPVTTSDPQSLKLYWEPEAQPEDSDSDSAPEGC